MEGPHNYFSVVELNARSNNTGLPTKEETFILSNIIIELEHLINGKSNYFKKNEKKDYNCREPLLENKCTIISV